jgi:hypothetical protein
MATILQLRRGTTVQHNTFTGAEGEVTVNTTKDTIVVHDGVTAGGFEIVSLAATQTLTNKTLTTPALNGAVVNNNNAVSAAGSDQAGATALTVDYNVVTTVAASAGVKLPTATAGRRIVIVNKGANTLSIYPATGGAIDAVSANAAIQVAANGSIELMASSSTQWYSIARINVYTESGTLLN